MHNQTDPTDLLDIEPTDLGTGIFLIPDIQDPQFGAMRKEFIPDISYLECVRRGSFAFAFKWVPQTVASEAQLRHSNCSAPCVQTCVMKGCLCNTSRGVCE